MRRRSSGGRLRRESGRLLGEDIWYDLIGDCDLILEKFLFSSECVYEM